MRVVSHGCRRRGYGVDGVRASELPGRPVFERCPRCECVPHGTPAVLGRCRSYSYPMSLPSLQLNFPLKGAISSQAYINRVRLPHIYLLYLYLCTRGWRSRSDSLNSVSLDAAWVGDTGGGTALCCQHPSILPGECRSLHAVCSIM